MNGPNPSKFDFSPYQKHPQIGKALLAYQRGDDLDALIYLNKAYEAEPALRDDPALDHLLRLITQQNVTNPLALIREADKGQAYSRAQSSRVSRVPTFISMRILLMMLIGVMLGSSFIREMKPFTEKVFEVERIQDKALQYQIIQPQAVSTQALILVADSLSSQKALLKLFLPYVESHQLKLIFPDEEQLFDENTLAALAKQFPNAYAFGFGDGGYYLSNLLHHDPDLFQGIILSGASQINVIEDVEKILIIYGQYDPLLEGSTNEYVRFTDIRQWGAKLAYAVIEGIGRELSPQQASISLEFMKNS